MTQKELSDALPISQSYLSKIENGLQEPNPETVEAISKELAIPSSVLVFLSLDEEDIPENKRSLFTELQNSIYDQTKTILTNATS